MEFFHKKDTGTNQNGQTSKVGKRSGARLKALWTSFVDQLGGDPYTDWAFTFTLNILGMIVFVAAGFWIYFDSGSKFKASDAAVEVKKPKISVQSFVHLAEYFETKKATEASLVPGVVVSPDPSR